MRMLMIENTGTIDPEAIRLSGFSSKRGDTSKIGMFGTGGKLSVATLLRAGAKVVIVSGSKAVGTQITYKTKSVCARGRNVDEVVMSVKRGDLPAEQIPMAITVDHGPQWEPWMAVREWLCNAIDEGGFRMSVDEVSLRDLPMDEGVTRVFIEAKPIDDVLVKWDHYFRIGALQAVANVGVRGRILPSIGPGTRIYRQGILIHQSDLDGLYDYDVSYAYIDETRKASSWEAATRVMELLNALDDPVLKRHILTNLKSFEEKLVDGWARPDASWTKVLEPAEVVGPEKICEFFGRQMIGRKRAPIVDAWSAKLNELPESPSVMRICGKGPDVEAADAPMTERESGILLEAVSVLGRHGITIDLSKVEVVNFQQAGVQGMARGGVIYIAHSAFANGIREVIATLLEEWSHLQSGASDETRKFEWFLIDRLVETISRAERAVW